MNVLIIGGTVFLGRHLTDAMVRRGHTVTHFNRGQSAPGGFPGIERLRGHRERDLGLLAGRRWDAVIDTCAYYPRQTAASAAALRDSAGCYVLISTINQYSAFPVRGITEDDPSEPEPSDGGPLDAVTYGPLKAGTERTVRDVFGDRALVVRPGYLVGPHDQSIRFSYWTRRLAAGGRVLVPGRPEAAWQVLDVRDLADWIGLMLETGRAGTFNAVGPAGDSSAGSLLTEMAGALAGDPHLDWVDAEYLQGHPNGRRWLDLADWSCLPEKFRWLYAASNRKAVEAGLTFRPVGETARDMAAWLSQKMPLDGSDRLDPEGERGILEDWDRARAGVQGGIDAAAGRLRGREARDGFGV